MSAAVIDSPQNEQAQAWWVLDFLVIDHRCAPGMETVVLEMALPVGSSPPPTLFIRLPHARRLPSIHGRGQRRCCCQMVAGCKRGRKGQHPKPDLSWSRLTWACSVAP